MSKDRDLIKKLFKIAESQQKIITKLAQAQGLMPDAPVETGALSSTFSDFTKTVQGLLASMTEFPGVSAVDCVVSPTDGTVVGKLRMPKSLPSARPVIEKLKELMAGKTMKDDNGKTVNVTSDKMKISFTGLMG